MTCFDSVDGILRPDLFGSRSHEYWANCVNENYKLNLITNSNYARKILHRYHNANLVGVEIGMAEAYVPNDGLSGTI